jgi:cobalt-zinc-cadmium efflux system outer membrane protein
MTLYRARMFTIVLSAIVATAAATSAASTRADSMVALDSLLSAALAHNPEILAARERSRAAEQREPQVSSLDDPMASYSHWLSSPETRVGPQTNVFMLSQSIPFPGKLGLKGDMANQDAVAQNEKFEATKRDVLFKVKAAYFDLYRVDQSLAILDKYLDLLRNFSKVAEEKYATGEGIQANALKSQVEISNILERRLMFERQRASIGARINALIDRPADAPIGIATSIDTTKMQFDDSTLVKTALANRQELKASEAMIRKSEFMKDLAGLQYYPNFNLQASYITVARGSSMAPDAGKDAYSVGVGISIPIELSRRSAAKEEAEATYRANQLSYHNTENDVKAEVEDLHFQLQSIGRTLDLYNQGLLVQSQSALESALSAYSTGKLDFLNLLDSERMLLQARLGYVEQQANYQKTLAALERAVGGRFEK